MTSIHRRFNHLSCDQTRLSKLTIATPT
jgi:hypothetical protein